MRTRHLIKLIMVLALVIIASLGNLPAKATTPLPADMLTSYYNNISLRQYQAAYAAWIKPLQTYDDFVTGYATTEHVTPYLGDYQGGDSTIGNVPGVLVGYHTDGTIAAYHGCFTVSFNSPQIAGWALVSAHFDIFANNLRDNDLIVQYLNVDCSIGVTVLPTLTPTPVVASDGVPDKVTNALTAYYELINKRDYTNAYAMWLHPLPGPKPNGAPAEDYRLPYDQFVSGYSTTKFVDVYPGVFDYEGASMGHSYLVGQFPVLLVGEHTDGTFVSYLGCYVIGGMQGIDTGFVSGTFKQISTGIDVPSLKTNLPSLKTICSDLASQIQF